MKKIIAFFEDRAFGVCTKLGDKFGLSIISIRMFFIYASFLTFGSPVILYLIMAFLLNFRKHLRRRNDSIIY